MVSRNAKMEAIFGELSERNKEIMVLVARSVKVARETAEQPGESSRSAKPGPYQRRKPKQG